MQNITLKPIKAQEVNVKLGGQNVLLRIVQRTTGLYMDIALEKVWIAQGVPCLNCNKIVRYPYLGFRGEIFFADTKGSLDPYYDELGGRFQLFYASAEEMERAS